MNLHCKWLVSEINLYRPANDPQIPAQIWPQMIHVAPFLESPKNVSGQQIVFS